MAEPSFSSTGNFEKMAELPNPQEVLSEGLADLEATVPGERHKSMDLFFG